MGEENKNHNYRGLDYMHGTGTRMDDYKWSQDFFEKKEEWKGCEQGLITTIRKETERMEEKEEAGYRSPT